MWVNSLLNRFDKRVENTNYRIESGLVSRNKFRSLSEKGSSIPKFKKIQVSLFIKRRRFVFYYFVF